MATFADPRSDGRRVVFLLAIVWCVNCGQDLSLGEGWYAKRAYGGPAQLYFLSWTARPACRR